MEILKKKFFQKLIKKKNLIEKKIFRNFFFQKFFFSIFAIFIFVIKKIFFRKKPGYLRGVIISFFFFWKKAGLPEELLCGGSY